MNVVGIANHFLVEFKVWPTARGWGTYRTQRLIYYYNFAKWT